MKKFLVSTEFDNLPDDIQCLIVNQLDLDSQIAFRHTCKRHIVKLPRNEPGTISADGCLRQETDLYNKKTFKSNNASSWRIQMSYQAHLQQQLRTGGAEQPHSNTLEHTCGAKQTRSSDF